MTDATSWQAGRTKLKKVPASEVKNRLGSIILKVTQNNLDVIVEKRGIPKAAIISYRKYEKLQDLKEQKRRQDAFKRLEALREQIANRNKDLTEKQAMEIADRITRSAITSLIKKGVIKFKK